MLKHWEEKVIFCSNIMTENEKAMVNWFFYDFYVYCKVTVYITFQGYLKSAKKDPNKIGFISEHFLEVMIVIIS